MELLGQRSYVRLIWVDITKYVFIMVIALLLQNYFYINIWKGLFFNSLANIFSTFCYSLLWVQYIFNFHLLFYMSLGIFLYVSEYLDFIFWELTAPIHLLFISYIVGLFLSIVRVFYISKKISSFMLCHSPLFSHFDV